MTDLTSWEGAARTPDYRAHIHPSAGDGPAAYEASGREMFDRLAEILGARRDQRIVDVGCGDGRVTVPLACYYHDVVGVDSSPTMLARLRARAPVPTLLIGGGRDIISVAAGVDACVCLAVLIHMTHSDGHYLLADMAAAVRPGGRIILWFPLYAVAREAVTWDDMTTWTRTELEAVCDPLGLIVDQAAESPGSLAHGGAGVDHGALTVLRKTVG